MVLVGFITKGGDWPGPETGGQQKATTISQYFCPEIAGYRPRFYTEAGIRRSFFEVSAARPAHPLFQAFPVTFKAGVIHIFSPIFAIRFLNPT
jgi:hypothetical protein